MAKYVISNGGDGLEIRNGINSNFTELYDAMELAHSAVIYVDSNGDDATGAVGMNHKPFATIDAALDAGVAITNLKIEVGMGIFAAPSSAKTRSNLWINGAGKPGYNWTVSQTAYGVFTITSPTALSGGTILRGNVRFSDKSNVHLSNFGVDVGPSYVAGGGTESDGIVITSADQVVAFPMVTNIVLQNITILGRTASSAFHALVMQSLFEPVIENIDTYFATHGIAAKIVGGSITNVRTHFHTENGIILKSNDYAYDYATRLSNFEITGGGGLNIEYAADAVGHSNISAYNGLIKNASFGVQVFGAGGINDSVHLDQIRSIGSTGRGFDIQSAAYTMVSNCINRSSTGVGFYLRGSANGKFNSLTNCMSVGATSGFDISAPSSQVHINNCKAASSSGFGFVAGDNVFGAANVGVDNVSGNVSGTITDNS